MNTLAILTAAAAGLGIALVVREMNRAEYPMEYATEDPIPSESTWGDWTDPASLDTIPQEGDSQTTGYFEDAFVAINPATYMTGNVDASTADSNVRAFLDMIAYAEGTSGPNGYRTMFGGTLTDSYADHPRKLFTFKNSRGEVLKTSAAGRYQFLGSTWDELKRKLGLQDFGPASQDAGAIELIRQRGALNDVKAGRIVDAIAKVRSVWASLPGAGYAQPERSITNLLTAYANAGGAVLTA